jgi:protocatechuate 3,4-dioxygenase beta subunit
VLFGLGAAILAGSFAPLGLAKRERGEDPRYAFGQIGPSIEGLPIADLRCTAGTLTQPQIEGPFYTPKTPLRRDIRDPFIEKDTLVIAGRVLDPQCRPLAGAVLDFWQTDHAGRYDQHGYRYRGHQYTDAAGRFQLVTVRPHPYTAMSLFRGPHIHVKVQGPATPLLTTQLYLPDAEELNARDGGYDPLLAMRYVGQDGPARRALFDFVLSTTGPTA